MEEAIRTSSMGQGFALGEGIMVVTNGGVPALAVRGLGAQDPTDAAVKRPVERVTQTTASVVDGT
jgi:hypothetical protein